MYRQVRFCTQRTFRQRTPELPVQYSQKSAVKRVSPIAATGLSMRQEFLFL